MNIRYKVYFCPEEDYNQPHSPGWENHLPFKFVRASNEDKAKRNFEHANPGLIAVKASKY